MRCIGGLLLKDWYAARRRCWPLLPIAAVFAACTVYADSAWFAAYPLLLGAMLPVTLQAYDDACGFPRFAAALPVSRRALVGARYVTALLAPLPGAALLLLAGLTGAAFGRPLPLGAGAIAALSLLPLLFSALALPLAFRFGTERARLLTVVLLGALCVLVMLPGGHGIALSLPGGAAHLAGEWQRGGERMQITAVPGAYSPRPPAHLPDFTRYIRARSGGYWIRVRPAPRA